MIALPGYVDPEVWTAFEEMRRLIKKPMTDYARKLIVYELQRIKDAGYCPNESLKQSIKCNWQDVFVPKDKPIEAKATTQTNAWLREYREAGIKSQTPEAHEARRRCMALVRKTG